MNFKEEIQGLNDTQLLNRIYEGKESYREGMYEILLTEANSRGLDTSSVILETDAREYMEKTTLKEEKNLKLAGWIFTFVAFGLGGIIFGLQLWLSKEKDKDGNMLKKYSKNGRSHGLVMSLVGGLSWLLFFFFLILKLIPGG